jgi:hypothetical protein
MILEAGKGKLLIWCCRAENFYQRTGKCMAFAEISLMFLLWMSD